MKLATKRRKLTRCVTLDELTPRHAQMLSAIWFHAGLSRSDLHEHTGVRLRTVGSLVEELVKWNLVEQGLPRIAGVGRPQVPLAVNINGSRLLGVSIVPKQVSVALTDLRGNVLQRDHRADVRGVDALMSLASRLIRARVKDRLFAIGISLSGFVDEQSDTWLLSSAHPKRQQVSLKPLKKAAGKIPIVIDNELHAMSAAVHLNGTVMRDDTLLIHLDDGRLAASMLVDGKPNRGSIRAANELGHTTMPVETERCYCGKVGCIERIFSRKFAGASPREFLSSLNATRRSARTNEMIHLTGRAIANAVNFFRPASLIIASPLELSETFKREFADALAGHTLSILWQRLSVTWQPWSDDRSATAAAMLPIADSFARAIDFPLSALYMRGERDGVRSISPQT
jgi:predicted NBD/HSP70 family sugar kinase